MHYSKHRLTASMTTWLWARTRQSVRNGLALLAYGYADVPMPAQPSTSVPDGPLLASLWRCLPTASAFGQQSPTFRATSSAQHLRPSGVFCCRTNCLELIAWWPTRSEMFCRHFQTVAKDVFVFTVGPTSVFSALEVLTTMRYINLHLTFDIYGSVRWILNYVNFTVQLRRCVRALRMVYFALSASHLSDTLFDQFSSL